MVREKTLPYEFKQIRCPDEAFEILDKYLAEADREYFVILCLDTKNNVNAINTVSMGTLDASPVHPREVFKAAILANSASLILAHNHPSGNPEPSREDLGVTKKLVECGKLLGIEVFDHIILGKNNFISLKERGDI